MKGSVQVQAICPGSRQPAQRYVRGGIAGIWTTCPRCSRELELGRKDRADNMVPWHRDRKIAPRPVAAEA